MDEDELENYVPQNSETSRLITKLTHMLKKTSLDCALGELLDTYLRSLYESNKYLENGIFLTNFTEAALILQCSVNVYSKKVDLLWDTLNQYHKKITLYSKDLGNGEIQRLEERERKYKRKKKSVIEEINVRKQKDDGTSYQDKFEAFAGRTFKFDRILTASWKLVAETSDIIKVIDCRNDIEKTENFFSFRQPVDIYNEHEEYVTSTNKLRSTFIFDKILMDGKFLPTEFSFGFYAALVLVPRYKSKHNIRKVMLPRQKTELNAYLEEQRRKYFSHVNMDANIQSDNTDKLTKNQSDCQDKMRRISVAETCISRLSGQDLEKIYIRKAFVKLTRYSCEELLEKANVLCQAISNPRSEDNDADSENKVMDLTDADPDTIVDGSQAENVDSFKTNTQQNVDKTIIEERRVGMERMLPRRIKTIKRHMEDEEETVKKIRRMSPSAIKKLLEKDIVVDAAIFERFFLRNYEPEDGEGHMDVPTDSDEPLDSSTVIGMDEVPQDQLDSGYFTNMDSSEILAGNDTTIEPVDPNQKQPEVIVLENEELSPATAETVNINQNIQTALAVSPRRLPDASLSQNATSSVDVVEEWREYMYAKLKTLSSRSDFDIHEYGTNILDALPSEGSKKFGEIVEGKSSSDVTRYFISTLQLANSCNVDIRGVQSGKLSNDTFSLTLLTKERYHERLCDYQAPSQVTLKNRLAKVKAAHSTWPAKSSYPISSKRRKYV